MNVFQEDIKPGYYCETSFLLNKLPKSLFKNTVLSDWKTWMFLSFFWRIKYKRLWLFYLYFSVILRNGQRRQPAPLSTNFEVQVVVFFSPPRGSSVPSPSLENTAKISTLTGCIFILKHKVMYYVEVHKK